VDLLQPGVHEREWGDTYQRFEGTKFLDFKKYIKNVYCRKILEIFGGTFVPPPTNIGLPLTRRKKRSKLSTGSKLSP
jgi:hypothetical protein